MVENRVKNDSRVGLWIVFGGLCVLIVGLVVAIVLVNEGGYDGGETEVVIEQNEGEINVGEMEKWEKAYAEFDTTYNDLRGEAEELLNNGGTSDIERVYELYDDVINGYISQERFDYAWAFIQGERDVLKEAGFDKEALKAMMRADYSNFPTARQYECYVEILKLAESISDREAIEKYEKLAADTKSAWESVQKATEEAAAQFEAELENAEDEPTDEEEGGGE